MEKTTGTDLFTVPIGPQHPALKEPSHFRITVDGEIVTDAVVRLACAHRGIEKAAEARNWVRNLYLFERVCGICSHVCATGYALGVERLAASKGTGDFFLPTSCRARRDCRPLRSPSSNHQ